MAVKDRNERNNQTQQEAKIVNIFDKGLNAGVESHINAEADAWARIAPPPDGPYKVKVQMTNKTFSERRRDEKDPNSVYYAADPEVKIAEGEYENALLFGGCTTLIGRGKEISTMAAILVKNGVQVPDKATDLQIARLFGKWLQREPTAYVYGTWQAWSKVQNRNVATKMEDCPIDEETGNHKHVFQVRSSDGTWEEVNANFKIKKWLSKAEYKEMLEAQKAVASKKAGKAKDDDDDVEEADTEEVEEAVVVKPTKADKKPATTATTTATASTAKKPPKAAPAPVEEEDDDDIVIKDEDEDEDDN